MMCDEHTQSMRAVAARDATSVHRGEAQAARSPTRVTGVDCGLRVVVDADAPAGRAGELGGLVADAAAHVEHGAGPDALGHLPVAGVVEREQGVGGGARHRAFAGQLRHRARLRGRGPTFPDARWTSP